MGTDHAHMLAEEGLFGLRFGRIEARFQRIAIAFRRTCAVLFPRFFKHFTPGSVTLIVFQNFSARRFADGFLFHCAIARAEAALMLRDDFLGFGKADRVHGRDYRRASWGVG